MWNPHVRVTDIFESVQQNLVSVFVVTKILFLCCNIDCDSNSLLHISNGSVQLESPLWLLWSIISLSHQIVNQFMGEWVHLHFGYHLNHSWDHLLALRHV